MSSGSKRMTRCGIGPRFSIITVLCGMVTGWLTYRYPSVFTIQGMPPWFFQVLGSVLLVAGTIVYVIALRTFNQGYRNKKLVTQGLYALARHPIYFAWIVLICPGVVLFFHSWVMLLVPPVAYLSFKASIHHEDHDLENQFGQAYLDYKARTPELFPGRCLTSGRHSQNTETPL
ncbi:MAG: isoprenylcysteine carboxylmethyltransferase family protein [Phycisphaerae bacterium]|nr:isoprenylcysteine carboxylmethyltransferase family protein [Phycisphaerae bacterium]